MPVAVEGQGSRGVAQHPLQDFHVRAGGDGERGTGVAEIVQPQWGYAGRLHRWEPRTVSEVLGAEEASSRRREHEALRSRLSEVREVVLQRLGHQSGYGHGTATGGTLRWQDHESAADPLDLLDDGNRPVEEVDVLAPEGGQLARPKAGIGASSTSARYRGSMAAASAATSSWDRKRIGSASTRGGLTLRSGLRHSSSFSTAASRSRFNVR
jgi:hypothetical protein